MWFIIKYRAKAEEGYQFNIVDQTMLPVYREEYWDVRILEEGPQKYYEEACEELVLIMQEEIDRLNEVIADIKEKADEH